MCYDGLGESSVDFVSEVHDSLLTLSHGHAYGHECVTSRPNVFDWMFRLHLARVPFEYGAARQSRHWQSAHMDWFLDVIPNPLTV